MDVAVVVGDTTLTRMAEEACPKDYKEDANAPNGIEANSYANVDADEPELSAKASSPISATAYR